MHLGMCLHRVDDWQYEDGFSAEDSDRRQERSPTPAVGCGVLISRMSADVTGLESCIRFSTHTTRQQIRVQMTALTGFFYVSI